jgi:photosystem II stability/assembly factor-like uncharacterized protein
MRTRPAATAAELATRVVVHRRGIAHVERREPADRVDRFGRRHRLAHGRRRRSWREVSPPNTAGLHFRDLAARDTNRAVAMTAGAGGDSRLYVTSDGGRTWRLTYQASDPATFFDAMAFYDDQHGIVVGDPISGKFQVLATSDGGNSWTVLPSTGMPAAQPDEYGFADSGTTVVTAGHDAWFASGGSVSRAFHSRDGGRTRDVRTTPILSGSDDGNAGIYGLAVRTAALGLAVGGDFSTPDVTRHVTAVSYLGGPWTSPAGEPSGSGSPPPGCPSPGATAVTVGINGSDVSYDAGQHWARFAGGELNSIDCAADGACWAVGGACWAVGDSGRVAVLRR